MLVIILLPCCFPSTPPAFVTSDIIIGNMTIGFIVYGFLYVVNLKQQSTLHGYQDMELQRFLGHNIDLLGSRDIICRETFGKVSNMQFPIGSQFETTIYLAQFLRYLASKIFTFGVMWHRWSSNHLTRNMQFPVGSEFEPTVYFAWFSRYASKILGHNLDFWGCDVIDHMTIGLAMYGFQQVSIWTDHISHMMVETLTFKYFEIMTLTFWGHVTSSVTWPLDSQYEGSDMWSIETITLSCIVVEILCVKHILTENAFCVLADKIAGCSSLQLFLHIATP